MGTVLSRNNRTVPAQPTTTAAAPTAASNDTQPPTPSTSSLPSPSTIPLASSDAPTPSTSSLTPALPPVVHVNTQIRDPTSKSALKKAAKQAAYDAAKPARRLKDKLKKKEKAEGKRKAYEMGETEGGGGKKARTKTMMPWNVRVVLDLGFDELMTENEIKSMATQISFCYASNRASSTPVTPLLVTSFSGRLKDRMDNNTKATYLKWKGMEWWEEGWESLYSPSPSSSEAAEEKISMGHLAGKLKSRADKSSIIYLSGDSPNVLTSLDEGTTYIIGGIVDHNRYKSLCLDKAEAMGIAHAQLPIGEYLPEMLSRKVLTVNQVMDIIVKWGELRDWKAALLAVMPQRKFHEGPKPIVASTSSEPFVAGGSKEEEEVVVAE